LQGFFIDAAQEVSYNFNSTNKCLFIFAIERKPRIDDTDISEQDAIGIWETDAFQIHCDAGAHFLIIETPVNQK
jgi:quercetin 2,3-dioxygenase